MSFYKDKCNIDPCPFGLISSNIFYVPFNFLSVSKTCSFGICYFEINPIDFNKSKTYYDGFYNFKSIS